MSSGLELSTEVRHFVCCDIGGGYGSLDLEAR